MIKLEEGEVWAFNVLNASIGNVEAERARIITARNSYIKLLEGKYNATLNAETGKFEEKPHQPKKGEAK